VPLLYATSNCLCYKSDEVITAMYFQWRTVNYSLAVAAALRVYVIYAETLWTPRRETDTVSLVLGQLIPDDAPGHVSPGQCVTG